MEEIKKTNLKTVLSMFQDVPSGISFFNAIIFYCCYEIDSGFGCLTLVGLVALIHSFNTSTENNNNTGTNPNTNNPRYFAIKMS